jgi:hypothetical protein
VKKVLIGGEKVKNCGEKEKIHAAACSFVGKGVIEYKHFLSDLNQTLFKHDVQLPCIKAVQN